MFNCSEQYFMYVKCLTFDPLNVEHLSLILKTTSATNVKKLGRQIKNYNNSTWNKIRYDVMKKGLIGKFTQNNDLKQKLLKTGEKKLYEASKNDNIWGIGFYADSAVHTDPSLYGQNLLGKCLMDVRNLLK